MERLECSMTQGGTARLVAGKLLWKAVAAVAILALVVLGVLVVDDWKGRESGPGRAPARQHSAVPAARPEKGIILFQSRVDDGLWQIFSLDLATGVRTRLTRSTADDVTPSASPDRSWIAFQSTRSGSAAIWRMRADGTGTERLTETDAPCSDPCWTQGGYTILYSSFRSGKDNIFALELARRQERQLTDSFWNSILPTPSPDGSLIAFARSKLGWDVYRMNADGSGVTALTGKGGNCRPDWSPDGKRIAYVSDVADGKGDVWTMNANGGSKMRITRGDDSYDYNPAWSPDGRWIVYETATGSKRGPWSLAMIPAEGGTPILLSPPGVDDRYPDWAPDTDGR
jgi:Tol biopolymer transport system component